MKIEAREYCLNCMKPLHDSKICGYCHFDNESYVSAPHCLIPETCLNHRYFIGRVLGEGGFGITYMGWDSVLSVPVAIKEFYPEGMVRRDNESGTEGIVYCYGGISKEEYQKGLQTFLQEARSQAKFSNLDGIAAVRDFFRGNNTAYIVMEYVEGLSAKQYIEKYGKISAEEVLEMVKPVLYVLQEMHENQFVHRDVSADNLMITNQKNMKLIDFGTSRRLSMTTLKTLTVMYKRGFAPEEQYRARGKVGPWTDVYGICAVMYYLISGKIPDEAPERVLADSLLPLKNISGIEIPEAWSDVIEKGLSVRAEHRYQTICELYDALFKEAFSEKGEKFSEISQRSDAASQIETEREGNQNVSSQMGKNSRNISTQMIYRNLEKVKHGEKLTRGKRQRQIILLVAAGFIFAGILLGNKFLLQYNGNAQNRRELLQSTGKPAEKKVQQTTIPQFFVEGQEKPKTPVSRQPLQSPQKKPDSVKKAKMIYVVGLSVKTAKKKLQAKGFSNIEITYVERENVKQDYVIQQNISKGRRVILSKNIVLTVGKRIVPAKTEVPKTIPKMTEKPKTDRKEDDDNVVGSLDSLLR